MPRKSVPLGNEGGKMSCSSFSWRYADPAESSPSWEDYSSVFPGISAVALMQTGEGQRASEWARNVNAWTGFETNLEGQSAPIKAARTRSLLGHIKTVTIRENYLAPPLPLGLNLTEIKPSVTFRFINSMSPQSPMSHFLSWASLFLGATVQAGKIRREISW